MAEKYYRVKKDTFLWKAGAILQCRTPSNQQSYYTAIEDIWDVLPLDSPVLYSDVVEHPDNAAWFERVYKYSALSQAAYYCKEKMLEMINKQYGE